MKFYPIQYLTVDMDGFTHQQQAKAACAAGFRWIQLRSKNMHQEEWLRTARDIREITHQYKATFIVNDNSEIAMASNADGVHLGKEDDDLRSCRKHYPNMLIGYSCNTISDIEYAQNNGADYCGIGPFRYTTTRTKLNPILGIDGLMQIMQQYNEKNLSIPLYAIGGITALDIVPIIGTGIHGVAVSSYITNALYTRDKQRLDLIFKTLNNINEHV